MSTRTVRRAAPVASVMGFFLPWGGILSKERVMVFVDGFNLYHAIDSLGKPHLKWLNLWELSRLYLPRANQVLQGVLYFSAYATWLPGAWSRHRAYVSALQTAGVTPIMSKYKKKRRRCHQCNNEWWAHEEKETDVKIGLYMFNHARRDDFDHAVLISNDSDLAPVVQLVRSEFSGKRVRVLVPPKRHICTELKQHVNDFRTITPGRIGRALFPAALKLSDGSIIARPHSYDPP